LCHGGIYYRGDRKSPSFFEYATVAWIGKVRVPF